MSRRAIPICVILLVDKVRPSEEMVASAWERNSDGGGVAWREIGKDGTKDVVWKKGIQTVAEMQELCKNLPIPYVAHFRVASSGGVRPSLTHPFPVSKSTSLALNGRTKGHVLFHNGDWKGWEPEARQAAIYSNTRLPTGRWSDSRGMAWLSAIYGLGFMEMLPMQKGIAFGPDGFEIFTGSNGWFHLEDVWCSNDYFMTRGAFRGPLTGKYCKLGTCTVKEDLDSAGYCPRHSTNKPPINIVPHKAAQESGGTPTLTPFRPLPPGQLITLEMAESLHKMKDQTGRKLLSKNLIKRIRRIYEDLESKGKRADRAKEELQKVSRSLTLNGHVH